MFLTLLSHLNHPLNSPDLNHADYCIWGVCSNWYIVRRLRTLIIWGNTWIVAGTWSVKS